MAAVWFYEDDGPDEPDPNACPWCGGDLDHDPDTGGTWCPDASCAWTLDDDEDDSDIGEGAQ
jgi:hypothetical protein